MGMKEWMQRLQPVQLYLVLALTTVFFVAELVVSHVTHALTLLMDSYHMLCNIIALAGCIITIKYGNKKESSDSKSDSSSVGEELKSSSCTDAAKQAKAQSLQETTLKNTFGWARIDVIVMLICCVFLASLCFSLIVEALQTLIHINHQDEMHYPIPVMCLGAVGVVLNGICYLLIGGCIFVIICSVIVLFTDSHIAKFVDPIISIISALSLLALSFPYMRESCLILLQTIPDTINIEHLRSQLQKQFPDVVNVHDLHVWQLTAHKLISTAHIVFKNPREYTKITDAIEEFFLDQGITQVTIQPEFYNKNDISALTATKLSAEGVCLMKCQSEGCENSACCPDDHLSHKSNRKSVSCELKSVKIVSTEDVVEDKSIDDTTSKSNCQKSEE